MNELVQASFCYDAMDEDTKSKLTWFETEIRGQAIRHARSGLEVGKTLTAARELFSTKSGFLEWVESKCGYSSRSCYNYMNAYRDWGGTQQLAVVDLGAMYVLSASSDARAEAMKLANRGEPVTVTVAKQLIREHKPDKEPTPRNKPGATLGDGEKAKLNAKLARDLIDRAVRAVDDLHYIKPNLRQRDRIVKALQTCRGAIW